MDELIIVVLILSNTVLIFLVVQYLMIPRRLEVLPKLLKEGKTQRVIKSAQAIVARRPKSVEAHYYLGMAYLAENKSALALIELKIVAQMGVTGKDIPEIEFRQTLAQMFIRCNQPEEALKDYLLLIKLAPEEAEFYYQAGRLLVEQNCTGMAKRYLYKAAELNPFDGRVHCELGSLLYKEQQTHEAQLELEKAIRSSRYNAQAYFYLGKLLKDAQDYTNAIEAFEQALGSKEYKIKALIERGICYMALNVLDKAIVELEGAIKTVNDETHPDSLYARYFIASCYERRYQIDKALAEWDRINEINKNFQDVGAKLLQYADYRYDELKDYLNYRQTEFLDLCKKVVAQGMGLTVQEVQVFSNGCEVIAVKGKVSKDTSRAYYRFIRFYRIYEPVQERECYDLLGQLNQRNIPRGIIVTSSEFTQAAQDFAQVRPIELLDKEKLLKLLQGLT
jgi:tetratricopeptide (TPR) repeat protein